MTVNPFPYIHHHHDNFCANVCLIPYELLHDTANYWKLPHKTNVQCYSYRILQNIKSIVQYFLYLSINPTPHKMEPGVFTFQGAINNRLKFHKIAPKEIINDKKSIHKSWFWSKWGHKMFGPWVFAKCYNIIQVWV